MYRAPTGTNSRREHNPSTSSGQVVLCPYKDADHHGSMESGRLALPDVLSARAGNRLGGIFLGHRLPANGTIFAPHCYATTFVLTNSTAFCLTNFYNYLWLN